jgi:DNA-binding GntR family transcriptional regulator
MAEIIEIERRTLHDEVAGHLRGMLVEGRIPPGAKLNARVQSLRFRTNQNGSKWQRAVQEHEQMLVALEARDPVALRAILIEHLRRKRDTILELMRAGDIYSQIALSP